MSCYDSVISFVIAVGSNKFYGILITHPYLPSSKENYIERPVSSFETSVEKNDVSKIKTQIDEYTIGLIQYKYNFR